MLVLRKEDSIDVLLLYGGTDSSVSEVDRMYVDGGVVSVC
jgi:hypothetical protein